jgi:hypothetical protein
VFVALSRWKSQVPKWPRLVLWGRIDLGIDIGDVDISYSIRVWRDPVNPAEIDTERGIIQPE